jgi:hypothetical protein
VLSRETGLSEEIALYTVRNYCLLPTPIGEAWSPESRAVLDRFRAGRAISGARDPAGAFDASFNGIVVSEPLSLATDVLVIGGGFAGAWAARRLAGADVVLVDKGYCGTSGVTATAGPATGGSAEQARGGRRRPCAARLGAGRPEWRDASSI